MERMTEKEMGATWDVFVTDKNNERNEEIAKETGNAVNHPAHYNQGAYECIDVMCDVFGVDAVKVFCRLNAFKYVWRSDKKNGREDLKKAMWYLKKVNELEELENEK